MAGGADAFFSSLSLIFITFSAMPVVNDHSQPKYAQTMWDFTRKFPDSMTVERYVYYVVYFRINPLF